MNALANETSLYLRQHANNPVNWYPWNDDALALAKSQDKPIFLSIGYSACHWCHVMEHECFENQAIADFLNAHYISIKVDREERPDLDQIYMTAHHALNNGEGGGWPLTVFLTPAGEPFYAGTYFPPDDRYGAQRPSFPRLLQAILDAWQNKRKQLDEVGTNITTFLNQASEASANQVALSEQLLLGAGNYLKRAFDANNGGIGYAPKFPHAIDMKLLMRLAKRFSKNDFLDMAKLTLEKMARGGMYDQVGGGFHRYSVDAVWLVPHFEKMLYDNALLAPTYAEAYLVTKDPFFAQIATEVCEYVRREMLSPEGAFYSTQDADSEGEEGKFYVWSETELEAILGEDARLAQSVFGTSPSGNFEGHNIPHRSKTDEQDAKLNRLSLEEFQEKLQSIKDRLYEVRKKRIWPGRDEKFLCSWNALMISAFAQVGMALNITKYIHTAESAAEFIWAHFRTPEGRLFRTSGSGSSPKINGYLDDYAYLADALVTLYEATFDPKWLTAAKELCDTMLKHFDDGKGGFYYTSDDHEQLIARTRDLQDGSVPSGNAMAVTAMLRIAKLTGEAQYGLKAKHTLEAQAEHIQDSPLAAGQMLLALDFHLADVRELALIGDYTSLQFSEVLQQLRSQFDPNRVLAAHDPNRGDNPVPLLQNKPNLGDVTLYVCQNFQCQAPLVGVAAIQQHLTGTSAT